MNVFKPAQAIWFVKDWKTVKAATVVYCIGGLGVLFDDEDEIVELPKDQYEYCFPTKTKAWEHLIVTRKQQIEIAKNQLEQRKEELRIVRECRKRAFAK